MYHVCVYVNTQSVMYPSVNHQARGVPIPEEDNGTVVASFKCVWLVGKGKWLYWDWAKKKTNQIILSVCVHLSSWNTSFFIK